MEYLINKSSRPWTCFPASLDPSNLIDVSTIDGLWGIFIDPETGRVHDCAEHYKSATTEARDHASGAGRFVPEKYVVEEGDPVTFIWQPDD